MKEEHKNLLIEWAALHRHEELLWEATIGKGKDYTERQTAKVRAWEARRFEITEQLEKLGYPVLRVDITGCLTGEAPDEASHYDIDRDLDKVFKGKPVQTDSEGGQFFCYTTVAMADEVADYLRENHPHLDFGVTTQEYGTDYCTIKPAEMGNWRGSRDFLAKYAPELLKTITVNLKLLEPEQVAHANAPKTAKALAEFLLESIEKGGLDPNTAVDIHIGSKRGDAWA